MQVVQVGIQLKPLSCFKNLLLLPLIIDIRIFLLRTFISKLSITILYDTSSAFYYLPSGSLLNAKKIIRLTFAKQATYITRNTYHRYEILN